MPLDQAPFRLFNLDICLRAPIYRHSSVQEDLYIDVSLLCLVFLEIPYIKD